MSKDSSSNPFLNRTTKLTTRQALRFVFPGCVLIPLRTAMLAGAVGFGYLSALLVTTGVSSRRLTEAPLGGWRGRYIRFVMPWCSRAVLASLGFNRIERVGSCAPKSVAPIVVANHIAPWEACTLYYLHSPSFIVASTNYKIPLIGTAITAAQQVRVDRDNTQNRTQVQDEIIRRANDPAWPQVAIFPEGTTTNGSAVISFRNGAFNPGLPVQPVAVSYPNTDIDPSWAGFDVSVGQVALRLMSRVNNTIRFEYLPVHTPTDEERAEPDLFAERVRTSLATALGVPPTQHSLEDLVLQNHAYKLKMDPKSVVVGMENVKSVLHLNATAVKHAIEKFAKVDATRSGTLRYHQFVESVGLADSDIMREAWYTLSKWEEEMNFNDFLYAVARIGDSEMASAKRLMENFEIIDADKNLCLDFDELFAVVRVASPHCTREQVVALFKHMDTQSTRARCIDVIEFCAFLRDNPLILLLFDLTLRRKSKAADEKMRSLGLEPMSSPDDTGSPPSGQHTDSTVCPLPAPRAEPAPTKKKSQKASPPHA